MRGGVKNSPANLKEKTMQKNIEAKTKEEEIIQTPRNLWEEYETDPAAEEEGVLVTDILPGVNMRIAKLWNKKHTAAVKELQKPYKKILKAGMEIPDHIARALSIKATAQAILVGWEGMTARDGKPLPYTEENAIEVLTCIPKIRDRVLEFASSDETFNKAEFQNQRKN